MTDVNFYGCQPKACKCCGQNAKSGFLTKEAVSFTCSKECCEKLNQQEIEENTDFLVPCGFALTTEACKSCGNNVKNGFLTDSGSFVCCKKCYNRLNKEELTDTSKEGN